MTIRSVWHVNEDQTREDTRFAPLGIMTPDAAGPLSTYHGVIPTAGNPLGLTPVDEMTAQIEIGRAVVQGLQVQGCYPVVVTAPELIEFSDGNASLNRIDTVAIVIRDDPYDSSGETDVRVVVLEGEPSATPLPPERPTACLPLADVVVRAGASAGSGGVLWDEDVTDLRTYCVALGGITIGTPDGSYAGQYRDTGGPTGVISRYNGSAWESTIRLDTSGQLVIGGDVNWRRGGTNIMTTDDRVQIVRSSSSDSAIDIRASAGETGSRLLILASGGLTWGPGGSSFTDTTLYRTQPAHLRTDGRFSAGVETSTTGYTNATGWSSSFSARRTCGVHQITLVTTRTGESLTASEAGNITDIQVGTIPTGWRPTDTIEGNVSSGYGSGSANISPNGTVLLRTWSGARGTILQNEHTLRFTFLFL